MTNEIREEPDHITSGRCKSGRRWFWFVSARSYVHDERHCEDPVCSPGLTGHEYGWEGTEEEALDAMQAAGTRLSGQPWGRGIGRPTWAAEILKQINAARRRARPPKQGAAEAASVEYLYEPWSWCDYDNPPYETHKGIREILIVKKTAKRIYYDRTDSWDRHDGVVTLGYIDRQDFEADTRCKATCRRTIQVGMLCAEHSRDFRHCAHFGTDDWYRLRCYDRGRPRCTSDCGADDCLLDVPGSKCAAHGYTWDHCPHGYEPTGCTHGSAAGVADLLGRHYGDGGTVYATREAAEEYLYRWSRELQRKRAEAEPELRRLRMAMAAAHPDRGGTNEGFIAARERYQRALRQAS